MPQEFCLAVFGELFLSWKNLANKIKEPYFATWWAIQGSLTSYTIDIPHYSIIINHFECQNVDIMIIFWYNNNSSWDRDASLVVETEMLRKIPLVSCIIERWTEKADKYCTKCMTTYCFVCTSLLLQPAWVALDWVRLKWQSLHSCNPCGLC